MKKTFYRIIHYLKNPELIRLFFLVRIAQIYTRIFNQRVYLSTSLMKKSGIHRFVESGTIFFSYKGGCYPNSVATGNAVSHIKDYALKFCTGLGLDIGSKYWPLPGAHAVDNNPHENAYKLDSWNDKSLDFVFSSHCLEHLHKWQEAIKLWISKLKDGGILFLYLPHPSMTLWHPGSPWVGDDHVWSPSPEILIPFLSDHGMEILEFDPGPDGYFSFYIAAKRIYSD